MSTSAAPVAKEARLHALDGLRGLAAVAVFFYHAVPHLPIPDSLRMWIDVTPLGPLCNGPGAVHVFFVLSGYVLALTLQKDTAAGRLPRYYVRRVFRIHPPYMAAVLLAWAASSLFLSMPHDVPDLQWRHVPAARLPIALAFPSMAFGMLPVGWSLFVEMAMSAIFPLLFLLAWRIHPLLPLAASLPLLGVLDPRIAFLRFTLDFAIGLTLRSEAARIARALAMLPRAAPLIAFFAGLAMLQAPMAGALITVGYNGLERGHSPGAVATFASAAGLLVIGTLHSPLVQRCLETRIARFFGRISYSFYLVHETVLLSLLLLAHRAGGSAALELAATLLAFVLGVALAELGWRAVESPAIRAGRAVIRAGGALFAPTSAR